jgi:hypothetical protein
MEANDHILARTIDDQNIPTGQEVADRQTAKYGQNSVRQR